MNIENTALGTVVPLDELRRIQDWSRANNIRVHMDGTRLWEAVAAGRGTVREFAQCCDVLMLDFSKNLGAPMGAMVLGSANFIRRLRRLRKSIGGGMRAAGILAAAALQAVVENFGLGQIDTCGRLLQSHELAKRAGERWESKGGKLVRVGETTMVWLDLQAAGIDRTELNKAVVKYGIRVNGGRLVFHHQVCELAMQRLDSFMVYVLT